MNARTEFPEIKDCTTCASGEVPLEKLPCKACEAPHYPAWRPDDRPAQQNKSLGFGPKTFSQWVRSIVGAPFVAVAVLSILLTLVGSGIAYVLVRLAEFVCGWNLDEIPLVKARR